MYKIITTLFLFIYISIPSYAGGIGFVDYNKIVENYNFAKITFRELDTKAAETRNYLIKKEEEYNQLESPVQKFKFEQEMQDEIKKRESAFNDHKEKREAVIKNRIQEAIDKIREEKGLDAVVDYEVIRSGGTDITDDVIKKLNE